MSYVAKANEYIRGVLSGEVAACKWIKAACERQRRDLERTGWEYRFDAEKAERVCEFVECLHHVKGPWAKKTETIKLEPWQCFLLTTLFGWVNSAGHRRFRTAYIEVARKNAKSTLAAGLMLYLLAADGEVGAEVYSAATTREQAKITFNAAKSMVRKDQELRESLGVVVTAQAITAESGESFAKALSSEANTLDGLNISGAIIDELHAHRTREVWDVIETATGSREQPLIVAITTAGFDRSSICFEQKTYVEKVMNSVLAAADGLGYPVTGATHEDETYFGAIYTLDEGDDWQDEANWPKANPNIGVSVSLDDMRRLARKAAQTSSAVSNFLTKRMNVWVGAETAWMNMVAWNRAALPAFEIEEYRKRPVILALDLASQIDIAALVGLIVLPGEQMVSFGRFYCPEDRVEESDNASYRGWAANGHLIDTEGVEIRFESIMEDLREIARVLDVRMVAFDKWQATKFRQDMEREGFDPNNLIEVPMNYQGLSGPMKDLETAVLAGRLKHDGNPAMAWMMSNVKAKPDNKENIYPVKDTSAAKIDGPVALMMAFHCLPRIADSISVYETRGALVL